LVARANASIFAELGLRRIRWQLSQAWAKWEGILPHQHIKQVRTAVTVS
jgi:hypothetical protein